MDTRIRRLVRADPEGIYRLVAAVEDWPRLLPHYRWVRVLANETGARRTVEMAARRDVLGPLGVPLWWVAIQTLHPDDTRVEFEHVRGVTTGMRVAWTIARCAEGETEVEIRHVFSPRWPVPSVLVRAVVGEYFVNGVARRTLDYLSQVAQRPS